MKIGAHVSTAGRIDAAVERAQAIGAEAMQIFAAAPQQWRRKPHPEAEVDAFREQAEAAAIGPNYIHGIYLTNLATADAEHLRKGVESLTADLRLASALGVAGVIFHVGSHKGAGFDACLGQIVAAMKEALAASPDNVWLCIENNAGTGDSVGSSFVEIGRMLDRVGSGRMKVCFDTCHAHSAGYQMAEREGFESAMAEFDREIGLDQLVVVHVNDSKTPFGSGRDRHENIGWGTIGLEGFTALAGYPAFRDATWLLEVPGFEGGGHDARNVKILKAIRDGTKRPRIPRRPAEPAPRRAPRTSARAKPAGALKTAAKPPARTAPAKATKKPAAAAKKAAKPQPAKRRTAKKAPAKSARKR